MIRGTDGFDNCADANVAWKYAHITPPTFNGGILAGRQPYGTPGGGNSYSVYNTGFSADVKTRVYGGLHTWIVGAAIHIADYANTSDQAKCWYFWRWESGPSNGDGTNPFTQLAVGYDDHGRLCFVAGGSGTRFLGANGVVIAASTYTLPINTWVYIEMKITFGVSGHIQVWADDALVFDVHPLGIIGRPTPTDPDRLSLYWENLGVIGDLFQEDDHYVADTFGTVNNDHLGPVRISLVFPNLDGIAEAWVRNTGATNHFCLDDAPAPGPGPDGAITELTGATSALDLYAVPTPACFGKILAVALDVVAHGTLGADTIDLVCRPLRQTALQFDVGSAVAIPAAYGDLSVVQAISELFPPDNSVWRDGDIGSALWGMRAGFNNKATQLFVEKVTSLRPATFDCGSGSYSYTR
jgi:hypothetical protein